MLEHGGNILEAAQRYGIPHDAWLDLSTGINPVGWPVPALPAETWRRLPEAEDSLTEAAAAYYGTPLLLPVAGSQAAIQLLPALRPASRVGILRPSYREHAHAWTRYGHRLIELDEPAIAPALNNLEVLVLCHPNNPSGGRFSPDTLLDWRARLAARGGWLVVDEAFVDAEPALSIISQVGAPGLIVLRSLGKFFGLAGMRAGFVAAWPALLAQMQELLGPWAVNGPARWIARHALQDEAWQQRTRDRLRRDSARLAALLARHDLAPAGGTALFQWTCTDRATEWHDVLARQGILTRLFDAPASLRFGLPGADHEWDRLQRALGNRI
ncbi:MAG: threonine-phosphate decarboxylase CobD [Burkholderiales bacterium]